MSADRDIWKRHCQKAEYELAEAKAEIESWKSREARWERSLKSWLAEEQSWNKESAELLAEIKMLRTQRDLERAAMMMGKPVGPEAEAQFEELKANAAIGRLVRGMRRGSTLRHTTDCADRPDWVAHWSGAGGMIITNSGSDDPAEALRAIQEEGDV